MSLRRDRVNIAHTWLKRERLKTVPARAYLKSGSYSKNTDTLTMFVMYPGMPELIAILHVTGSGAIEITCDHRPDFLPIVVKDIDAARVRGRETEERFLKEANTRRRNTPPWFVHVERASTVLDAEGIDALATIALPDGIHIQVPIQIKSSEEGREKYLKTRPDLVEHGVVVLVIRDTMTPKEIRTSLYKELAPIQQNGADVFGELIARLATS